MPLGNAEGRLRRGRWRTRPPTSPKMHQQSYPQYTPSRSWSFWMEGKSDTHRDIIWWRYNCTHRWRSGKNSFTIRFVDRYQLVAEYKSYNLRMDWYTVSAQHSNYQHEGKTTKAIINLNNIIIVIWLELNQLQVLFLVALLVATAIAQYPPKPSYPSPSYEVWYIHFSSCVVIDIGVNEIIYKLFVLMRTETNAVLVCLRCQRRSFLQWLRSSGNCWR